MKYIQAGHNWVHDSDYMCEKKIEKNFSNRIQIILIRSKCTIRINEIPSSTYGRNTLCIAQSGSDVMYGSDGSENFVNDWLEFTATAEEMVTFGLDPELIVPEINDNYTNLLSELIHDMASVEINNPYHYEVATNAYLQLFLVKLAQYVSASDTQQLKTNYRHPHYTKFVKLRNRIFSSHEIFSVAQLASEANMSESHFRRCYKEIFHIPIHTDLIAHKIELSQQLLKDPNNYTTLQIADMLGYNNHEHFFRQFKKITHITPSEYRKAFYETIVKNRGK